MLVDLRDPTVLADHQRVALPKRITLATQAKTEADNHATSNPGNTEHAAAAARAAVALAALKDQFDKLKVNDKLDGTVTAVVSADASSVVLKNVVPAGTYDVRIAIDGMWSEIKKLIS